MASDVRTYLQELKAALVSAGADPALIQDALFDAEEYLQAEMAGAMQNTGGTIEEQQNGQYAECFAAVVEGYGSPTEVAAAYLDGSTTDVATAHKPQVANQGPVAVAQVTTSRCAVCGREVDVNQAFCTGCGNRLNVAPPPPPPSPTAGLPFEALPAGVQQGLQAAAASSTGPSVLRRIFGPFAEGRVWTSLVYMILSLATGIAYFTIVVTGLSVAGGMMVLIVGVPLFMLVLAIVRGTALLEGRLVEGLLGTRMPRRGRSAPPNLGFWNQMLWWLKDGRTWASMAYMLLMLPLGITYFTIAVTGLSVSLCLVTAPIWVWFASTYGDTTIVIHGVVHNIWPLWTLPIAFVLGLVLLVGFMHLVKWIGKGHAELAKAMLVRLS